MIRGGRSDQVGTTELGKIHPKLNTKNTPIFTVGWVSTKVATAFTLEQTLSHVCQQRESHCKVLLYWRSRMSRKQLFRSIALRGIGCFRNLLILYCLTWVAAIFTDTKYLADLPGSKIVPILSPLGLHGQGVQHKMHRHVPSQVCIVPTYSIPGSQQQP